MPQRQACQDAPDEASFSPCRCTFVLLHTHTHTPSSTVTSATLMSSFTTVRLRIFHRPVLLSCLAAQFLTSFVLYVQHFISFQILFRAVLTAYKHTLQITINTFGVITNSQESHGFL